MKIRSLFLILLLAVFMPWAAFSQQTILLSENFDDMSSISASFSNELWYAYKAGSGNNWSLNTSSSYANSGSKSAKYAYSSSYAADCYLVSAPFNVSASMTELNVSLYERVRSSTYKEKFEVFFVKASDLAAAGDVATATRYAAVGLEEKVYDNESFAQVSGSCTNSALAGKSVRVVVHCTSAANMWELYIDDITVSLPSTDPYISLAPASETVLTGFTKTLTATYGNVTGTPTITYTSSNEGVATVSGNGTTATVTGEAPGTATITATMNYQGTDYTATAAITVEDPSYCEPSFTLSANYDIYITSFTTSVGINNSTGFSTGGYGDYYDSHAAEIEPGEALDFTVSHSSQYGCGFAIWVDWNQDYEFSADERVAATSAAQTTSWSGSFSVPSATAVGDYRMRVLMQYSTSSPSNPCVSAYYGEGEDYKLTVIAANPYQKPNNLTVSNLTGNSATINWEAPNENVTGYKYQYKPEGGEWSTLTSTTTLSAPLTGLTGNTTYEFQVQAIYAGGESAFASKTFTTECDAYAIPYTFGFETAEIADLNCWTIIDIYGRTSIGDENTFSNPPITGHTGNNYFVFAYYNYPDTDPQYMTLISPEITGMVSGLHVEFYYLTDGSSSYPESFRVGYSTTDKNLSSFTWVNTITDVVAADYQLFKANYPANAKYVAVQHLSDDMDYLILDDFSFTEMPSCVEPSNVLVSNITTSGAALSWTPGGTESAWDIYVTDDVADVPVDATTPTYPAVTSNTNYPISGLASGTTYYVYLRSACDATTHSDWTMPTSFNTACEAISLPYQYDFEDDALPLCWNTIGTNSGWITSNISSTAPQQGSKHFVIQTSNNATGTQYVVLPEVDADYPVNGYEITFYSRLAGGSTSGRTLAVGVMTDPTEASTFVQIGDAFTPTSDYIQYKVRLNTYTGNGQYIAIKHNITTGPYSTSYTYIDNLEVNPLPSCLEPEGLTVTEPTPHGATFGWTAGNSETAWQLYFSKTNEAPADDIDLTEVVDADSNPFTVESGLDAETDYYVWVRANCGGTDGFSIWVGPEIFTTGIACPAPTIPSATYITGHTATLNWIGTSESYLVSYRTTAYMKDPVLNEEFKTSTLPTGWDKSNTELTEDVLNGTSTISSYSSGGWNTTSYGLGQYNMKMNIYQTSKYWLITKNITLGNNNTLNFDAAITAYNSNNAPAANKAPDANSRFVVLITTDNQATWSILREWNNTGSDDVLNNISNTANNFSIDLSSYAGETVKIAFYGGQTVSGPDCDLHIDNVIIGEAVPAGIWTTKTTDASPYQLTGLLAETTYEAYVVGDCGTEGYSAPSSTVTFTTTVACLPVGTLAEATEVKSTSAKLSWTLTDDTQTSWDVAIKAANDADFTIRENEADTNQGFLLVGLDSETTYFVKVRANCGAEDGTSEWSNEISFTTAEDCMKPTELNADNITAVSANITWTGESDEYNIQYWEKAEPIEILSEGFEGGSMPEGWEVTNTWAVGTGSGYSSSTVNTAASGNYNVNYYNSTASNEAWLITPQMNLEGATQATLSFMYVNPAWYGGHYNLKVYYRGEGEWQQLESYTTAQDSWIEKTIALTGFADNYQIGFYVTGYNNDYGYGVGIDDVKVTLPGAPAEVETATSATESVTLNGLEANKTYEVKVQGVCDDTPGEWSDIFEFTTTPVPSFTKEIEAYNGNDNGWYLIASPLYYSIRVGDVEQMTDNEFDLYRFNQAPTANGEGQYLEWENYKSHTEDFLIESGIGYLYANSGNVTLTFTGNAYEDISEYEKAIQLRKTDVNPDVNMHGWNLVGNPYGRINAYIDREFYVMNPDGNDIVPSGERNYIEPMEGVFVLAQEDQELFYFHKTPANSTGNKGSLSINVTEAASHRGNGLIDRAVVRFNEGDALPKFQLNPNHSKVYITQGNKDYSVVRSNGQGEMPVNFRANKNGQYTFMVNADNVEMSYLHLIDNMTGADIDLLQTPSYSFNATTSDYESRFRLVFATGTNDNSDSFAFFSNGNLIVSNEGQATLQVVDVNGRILSSRTINGSASVKVDAAPGVYVLRLINGTDVKVQKVVVR